MRSLIERNARVLHPAQPCTFHATPRKPHPFHGAQGGNQVTCLTLSVAGSTPSADVFFARLGLAGADSRNLGRMPSAKGCQTFSVKTGVPNNFSEPISENLPSLLNAGGGRLCHYQSGQLVVLVGRGPAPYFTKCRSGHRHDIMIPTPFPVHYFSSAGEVGEEYRLFIEHPEVGTGKWDIGSQTPRKPADQLSSRDIRESDVVLVSDVLGYGFRDDPRSLHDNPSGGHFLDHVQERTPPCGPFGVGVQTLPALPSNELRVAR